MSAVWLHSRAVGISVCQLSGYIVGLCVSVYVSCLAT